MPPAGTDIGQARSGAPARGRLSLGLAGLGLYLFCATQPWVSTLVEVAPGGPRTRGALTGSQVAGWSVAAALAGSVAVVVGVTSSVRDHARTRTWMVGLGLVGATASLIGAVSTAVRTAPAGRSTGVLVGEDPLGSGQVVSATATGWLWVALGCAVVAALSIALGLLASARTADGAPSPVVAPPVPDQDQQQRVDLDRAWRALSEGQDPTDAH